MNFKILKTYFLFIFLAELFSFFGFLVPDFNKFSFFVVIVLVLFLSLRNLEYGVLILLAELFIGSKGYLFFFEYNGISISIRIALWLVIMSVWLGKVILNLIKTKKLEIKFLQSSYFYYFLALFVFIAFGAIKGFLNNNIADAFFDFNGWLYFSLVFPLYDIIKSKDNVKNVLEVLSASVVWLIAKTFLLVFVFSHFSFELIFELYRWVRVSGVGEITNVQGGFNRIFIQSQVFVLMSFFLLFLHLVSIFNKDPRDKERGYVSSGFVILASLISVILVSFSRSFWVGMTFGVGLGFLYMVWSRVKWQNIFKNFSFLFLSIISAIIFIIILVLFPYPKPIGGFSATQLLTERASSLGGEAAISSRRALLPVILKEIKKAPFFGEGFGATVTYITSDPRVLETNPAGEYTTYAFEWGWLDIWLKIGIFGMISYLVLITKIFVDGFKKNQYFEASLVIGLVVVAVVSIFSPYLNHPLGIGYLILVSAILDKKRGLN